jgi:hypothetical protein
MVAIETNETGVTVTAPYNSGFIDGARKLGGKWNPPSWVFDTRDEVRVRALYYDWYGTWDDLCTLRITWSEASSVAQGPVSVHGRDIAKAFGRDSGAKLAAGVVVLAGGFSSGGSVKNWVTRVSAGTVVSVRDFPGHVARALASDQPAEKRVYAIEDEGVDRAALTAERERLVARIAEIDAALAI